MYNIVGYVTFLVSSHFGIFNNHLYPITTTKSHVTRSGGAKHEVYFPTLKVQQCY